VAFDLRDGILGESETNRELAVGPDSGPQLILGTLTEPHYSARGQPTVTARSANLKIPECSKDLCKGTREPPARRDPGTINFDGEPK